MKLSVRQKKEIREKLAPVLAPYFEHQGWPGLGTADMATELLLDFLRGAGVSI